jgi:hypothetical protein
MHLIGIAFLLGSILLVDLRVIGLARWLSVSTLSGKFLLRVTWVGFALLTISGFCLFSAYALDNVENAFFLTKMALIALAGINAALFHVRVYAGILAWDRDTPSPGIARMFTSLSVLLWLLIVACGRLIAYPELFPFS